MIAKFVRKLLYWLLSLSNKVVPIGNQVVVLALHSFSDSGWRFSIPLSKIDAMFNEYTNCGYSFINMEEFSDIIKSGKRLTGKKVLVTIDDGYKDNLKVVSVMRKYKISPILFVTADPERSNRAELGNSLELLNFQDIKYLKEEGWSIGCHSMTHTNITGSSDSQLSDEVVRSKARLEEVLGEEIKYFSYPKGNSEGLCELVKSAGYELAFGMNDELLPGNVNLFEIPRVGLDGSHGVWESVWAASPNSIQFRMLVKKLLSKGLIERLLK